MELSEQTKQMLGDFLDAPFCEFSESYRILRAEVEDGDVKVVYERLNHPKVGEQSKGFYSIDLLELMGFIYSNK